jgi:cytochrome oxidase Cu insertion factor (SCO1/SenC/PrrC family)
MVYPLIVMTMAYTTCRRVCSTTTLVLSDIQKRLDAMKIDADFVVVGLDPDNDSPAEWRDYRSRRNLNRANWHFLTGDADSTKKLARGLDVSFWTYHDHIVHDFRIVLFDAQWHLVAEVDWADTGRLEGILSKIPAAIGSPRPLG